MSEWFVDELPGWGDCGRRVEVETESGNVITGTLSAEDWDGYPLFSIWRENGAEDSFIPNRWRFIP